MKIQRLEDVLPCLSMPQGCLALREVPNRHMIGFSAGHEARHVIEAERELAERNNAIRYNLTGGCHHGID